MIEIKCLLISAKIFILANYYFSFAVHIQISIQTGLNFNFEVYICTTFHSSENANLVSADFSKMDNLKVDQVTEIQ